MSELERTVGGLFFFGLFSKLFVFIDKEFCFEFP